MSCNDPAFGEEAGFVMVEVVGKVMLINRENGHILVQNVRRATTFWSRLRGLMFTPVLQENTALHIEPCQSIHTFFMRYSIDVLYLNENRHVIEMEFELKPGRIGRLIRNVKSVVELPVGKIQQTGIRIGDAVEFVRQ